MDRPLEQWKLLTAKEREAIARSIVKELPSGFSFRAVKACRYGSSEHYIAFFGFGGATFALVPAASDTIGFDCCGWQPTPEERESWQRTSEEYGINKSSEDYVAEVTLRPRPITVGPMLIETEAGPVPSGSTHAEVVDEYRSAGFRLLTSDEWEYACGGGEPTLFRWGDHAPCDRYPVDRPRKLTEWGLHRRPNAFGLTIATNPYKCELVAELGTTRGGDGGGMICGGAGFFIGWLALATAYFEEHACRRPAAEPIEFDYIVARRVLDLKPSAPM